MQKHRELTLSRLKRFTSEAQLGGKIYPQRAPVSLSSYAAQDRIRFHEAVQASYRPMNLGERFTPLWSTHWVRVEIDIPKEWKNHEVHLLWDSTSEAMVWTADGHPMQGLTGSGSGWASGSVRPEYRLVKHAHGGEHLVVYIEVACNGLFGAYDSADLPCGIGYLRQAEIAIFDPQAWDLFWDFQVIADMANYLPENTPRGGQALYTANQMVDIINLDDPSTWKAARQQAAEFFSAHNGDGQHNLSAIGHAHIDTAWLWPLAETKRKCARTFSTAVLYMEDYPDYLFACSQAVQYEWMKELYPDLYAKIKTMVVEGRFIPVGGTWVEPDTNVPSGESLVRQFLVGQRFFRQEFGLTCNEFWVPDVFGYSAALPQIMRQAGIRYFLTQKMSWNQFNKLPSHTFYWEGLDGSQILTHFPPADTYNSMANVKEVLYNVSNFKDHERSRESYLLFGFGDGGGGPSRAMLEQLNRMGDVDGLPRVVQRSSQDFFQRCEADAKDLLIWRGELYFELHRGTYTTQAANKRDNRRSEFILHDLEFLASIAHVIKGTQYPTEELTKLWKIVLTNQFHDILPGSSISMVYQDSAVDYSLVLSEATRLRSQAAAVFAGDSNGAPDKLCAINTLSAARSEVVELPEGTSSPQTSADGKPLGVVSAPPLGYSVFTPQSSANHAVRAVESSKGFVLENDYVKAIISKDGSLTSFYDKKAGRESIQPEAKGNRLILFDDNPANFEAWDVDIFHLEKFQVVGSAHSAKLVEAGPLRAAVAFEYQLSQVSMLTQTIFLTSTSPRLDFDTTVEWHENSKFLKVEFPFNLRADKATYEVQFGYLERPTHFNTSWDMARFEVCAHHWADMSEPDFGVALLNDSKYGYSAHDNVMRLSLLRSPKSPDPIADMGRHTFRYGLLPHAGSLLEAGVIEEGFRFNNPMMVLPTQVKSGDISFFKVTKGSLILDTVKKAEDSTALILRLYEAHGKRGTAQVESSLPVSSAARCNLLEEDDVPLTWTKTGLQIDFRPFELITLKLHLG